MRTDGAICLGVTAASIATIVGVPTYLVTNCHKEPEGTKATAKSNTFTPDIKCPYTLLKNGDVIGGTLPREKKGHIFPNGTVLDKDGLFKGEAKGDNSIFLAYPGLNNIDAYINSSESGDGALGVRATGLVDGNRDVWRNTDTYRKSGKNRYTNEHSSPKKVGHISPKSDKTTTKEKNGLGIFLLG